MTAGSLGLLALMASVPFLFPSHTFPISSFWSEWWAGVLGLCAAAVGLLVTRSSALLLPKTLCIPLILLSAVLVQFLMGRLAFPQLGLLLAIYLLWGGLLIVLGRHLAETIGMERLADTLAGAIAIGALIGTLIALGQWMGVINGLPWIFSANTGVAYGNLAQSNHHTHYSWLGIASVLYLKGRGLLGRVVLWPVIILMALGSVLSGSRSVLLYPVVLLAAVVWLRLRAPRGEGDSLLVDVAILLPLVVVLNGVVVWVSPRLPEILEMLGREFFPLGTGGFFAPPATPATAITRLYEPISGPSERLAIARAAWSAFVDSPWLGQGLGNYAWASFLAASTSTGPSMMAEHAHNFVLHCLAEFGAPVTIVVLLSLAIWARRFAVQPWGLPQLWCAGVLGIGAVHSLLEYPLWYSYFLGPTALLLGASDTSKAFVMEGRRMKAYLSVLALVGVVVLADLRKDYMVIEAASYQPLAAHPDRERAWRISMDRLLVVFQDSLLSPWAMEAFVNLAEPSRHLAEDRAALCEKGIRFAPARTLVARCAMHLAIAGRNADAQQLGRAVLAAFPAEREATIAEWQRGARIFPEVLGLIGDTTSAPFPELSQKKSALAERR